MQSRVYETERCPSYRLSVPFPLRTLLVCGLMDNIKMWTGLPVEESVRMTEDRDKWRKYVCPWCGQLRQLEDS